MAKGRGKGYFMKLGGMVPYTNMREYITSCGEIGFSSTVYPCEADAAPSTKETFSQGCKEYGMSIAEVGVWRNAVSPDEKVRKDALAFSIERLALADELGAGCCVNISGAAGDVWDAPYRGNYAADHYALVVDTVREIIDAVKPKRAKYCMEPMQWMVPDSAEGYLSVMKDIDRKEFGVHMDACNFVNSAYKFLFAKELIDECFSKLGPYIVSCHIKDLTIEEHGSVTMHEVLPGKGSFPIGHYLKKIHQLCPDMPGIIEHLPTKEDYEKAFSYVSSVAKKEGVPTK